MRTQLRPFPLISLLVVAAMLAPVTAVRATSDAVITVNELADELNNDGDCSLREAIQAANLNSFVDACPRGVGDDRINLPNGVFTLSLTGTNEDSNATGDLDIRDNLVIQGVARDFSVIDGNDIDRVFHVITGVTVTISRLTIQHGSAMTGSFGLGGGGILNQGTLTLQDVSLQENVAEPVGGGMDNFNGIVTVINSSITGNTSTEDGGGLFNDGQLYLESSTLSGNTADIEAGNGGGLDNRDSATIRNVTISGNTAWTGGGLFNDGMLFVLYSTIVANTATVGSKGGNIEVGESFRMKTTIVANSLGGPNCAGSGAIVSEGHNLENTNTCSFISGTDLPNTNPMIGPLADNEGPTLTHALQEGSLAIDAGDDVDCPEKDQRGAFRPADGDGDAVAICDIGAFEYEGIFPKSVFIPYASR